MLPYEFNQMKTAQTLRILHVANFERFKYGQWYMGLDSKLSYGFVQLGHCVESFSHRDVARAESFFKSKKGGTKVMNRRLLEMVDNYQPDFIMLGHSELVTLETLEQIRSRYPGVKIGMWYCDPLFHEHGVELLNSRTHLLDALFTTTGGPLLEALGHTDGQRQCTVAHIPNWVYRGAESGTAFSRTDYESDLVFAGSDYHEPERQALLKQLRDEVQGVRFRIFQALDNPRIHGRPYYAALESSLMGLSLSRRVDVDWYSSDRLQQMLGNGLCTFSPRTAGLEKLFSEQEVVWFDSSEELVEKVAYYKEHEAETRAIAEAGWHKVHEVCSAQRIAQFILEVSHQQPLSETYEWADEVYRKDVS